VVSKEMGDTPPKVYNSPLKNGGKGRQASLSYREGDFSGGELINFGRVLLFAP